MTHCTDWYSAVAQDVASDAEYIRDLANDCDDPTKPMAERIEDSAYAAGEVARIVHRLLETRYEDGTRVVHDREVFRAYYGPAISTSIGVEGRPKAMLKLADYLEREAEDHEDGERGLHDPDGDPDHERKLRLEE